MWWLSTVFAESTPVVVHSKVKIVDQHGVRWNKMAERSEVVLTSTASNWWDTLPVMRRLETFHRLDYAIVDQDAMAILQWYRANGWRDAEVRYVVKPFRSNLLFGVPSTQEPYSVVYQVTLGERWTLNEIALYGLNLDDSTLSVHLPSLPRPWSTFEQESIEQELRIQLQERGYANPKVHWQSSVVENEQLSLEGYVEWGKQYSFGAVQIDGLDDIPISTELMSWTGETYALPKEQMLQHRLERSPAIANVTVLKDIDPQNQVVNLTYQVTPNTERSVSGAGGLTSEATTWAVDGGVNWLFIHHKGMLHSKGRHTLGYRMFPQQFHVEQSGVASNHILENTVGLRTRSGIHALMRVQGQTDLQIGYRNSQMNLDAGLRWIPHRDWTVDLVGAWNRHDYSASFGQQEMFDVWFGQDGLQSNLSSQQINLDVMYLKPESFSLKVSMTPFGQTNQEPFQRFWMQGESWMPTGNVLFRNRVEFGALRWTDTRVNTLHNRFFLGGGQSVRGWSFNKLHPPEYTGQHFDVNLGGDKSLFLSSEVQYTVYPGYKVLTFVDVGSVLSEWDDPMRLSSMYASTGVGVIIPTMAGDVTFTEAVRLNRDVQFEHAPNRWVFHCILVRELGE